MENEFQKKPVTKLAMVATSTHHQKDKMKFIVSLLLIMLMSFVASLYFPWWIIAIVSFIVSTTVPQGAFISFVSGFLALFILWGMLAFSISYTNEHILAHRISLVILKTDNPYLLMLVSAVTGALVAGFAALSGHFFKKLFARRTAAPGS